MSKSAEVYHRQRLELNKRQIRLLKLQPGKLEDPIRVELSVVDLNRSQSFEALSYTWGQSTQRYSVALNDAAELSVTDNLFNALRRLRNRLRSRDVWIDAICIDQSNAAERSHQVSLMQDIYRLASSVLIWVGEPSPDLKPILPFRQRNEYRSLSNVISALMLTEPRWYDRAWTIQEYLLAQKRFICAGSTCIEFQKLQRLPEYNEIPGALADFRNRLAAMQTMDIGRSGLLGCYLHISNAHPLQATDPRDLVYSLLGIVQKDVARIIGTDYTLTPGQTFAKATFYSLVVQKSLFPLWLVYLRWPSNQVAHLSTPIPTWSIDFRVRHTYRDVYQLPRMFIERPAMQSAAHRLPVALGPEFMSLVLTGERLGTVNRVIRNISSGNQPSTPGYGLLSAQISHLTTAAVAKWQIEGSRMFTGHVKETQKAPSISPCKSSVPEPAVSALHHWAILTSCGRRALAYDPSESLPRPLEHYFNYLTLMSKGWVLFASSSGFIGIAGDVVLNGDVLVLSSWEDYACILRPTSSGRYWAFLGLAYLHGFHERDAPVSWNVNYVRQFEEFCVC